MQRPFRTHDLLSSFNVVFSLSCCICFCSDKPAVPTSMTTTTSAVEKSPTDASQRKAAELVIESQFKMPKSPSTFQTSTHCSRSQPMSPKPSPKKFQEESSVSPLLMESPESPPQDQGPTPEGHLLLNKVPAKQLWPTSFVNMRNGKDSASWPAAFVNTHSGAIWPNPGLVGGAAIKQETTKSSVSPQNPSPDVSDLEQRQGKGHAETTSESEETFQVPDSMKIQRRHKKREDGSCSPEETNSDSQSDTETNKRTAPKLLRIPADAAAVKNLDDFILRHELDNTTVLSRVSHDLDRGMV